EQKTSESTKSLPACYGGRGLRRRKKQPERRGGMACMEEATAFGRASVFQARPGAARRRLRPAWREVWERHAPALAVLGNACCLGAAALAGWRGASGLLLTALFAGAYVAGGALSLVQGVRTLVSERRIDVDLLMVMAALSAAFIGEPFEGGVLLDRKS